MPLLLLLLYMPLLLVSWQQRLLLDAEFQRETQPVCLLACSCGCLVMPDDAFTATHSSKLRLELNPSK